MIGHYVTWKSHALWLSLQSSPFMITIPREQLVRRLAHKGRQIFPEQLVLNMQELHWYLSLGLFKLHLHHQVISQRKAAGMLVMPSSRLQVMLTVSSACAYLAMLAVGLSIPLPCGCSPAAPAPCSQPPLQGNSAFHMETLCTLPVCSVENTTQLSFCRGSL